jgi:hypothetical protein
MDKNNDIKIDFDNLSKLKNNIEIEKKNAEIEQKKLIETDCLNLKNAFEKLINHEINKNLDRFILNDDDKVILNECVYLRSDEIVLKSSVSLVNPKTIKKKCNIDFNTMSKLIKKNAGIDIEFKVKHVCNFCCYDRIYAQIKINNTQPKSH